MGFGVVEEKEIPEYSTNDAGKILKVDPTGVYLQWLQETTSPAELPSQTGNAGRFLTTNGSVASWSVVNQVPGATAGNNNNILTYSSASSTYGWSNSLNVSGIFASGSIGCNGVIATSNKVQINGAGSVNDQRLQFRCLEGTPQVNNGTRQGIYSPAVGSIAISTNSDNTTNPPAVDRLVISDNFVTVTNSLNLTRVGSAAEPTLIFNDNTATPAASRTGIWGTDDNIFFGTAGSQRMNISNSGASITGDLTVSGRATIPDVVYPFDVFTSSGSTADFTLAQNTRSNVRLEMDTFNTILRFPALVEGTFYRIVPFRNGTTATLSFRPANSVIMHLYSGGSRSTVTGNAGGTIGYSILPGTFYECLFSSGAWYVVAGHPVSTSAFTSDVSVGGALSVTGNLTASQQIIQPFFGVSVTANSQTFDLISTMSGNVVILMGTFTPVTVRFNTTGFVSGSQFDLIPNSNLSGAVLNFTVTGGATLRIYQGGLVTTHSAPVAVSKDTTYRCEFHDNIWYITSNFVSGNANFPGTVTAIGFSSSGSASITNNLTVGGYIAPSHVELPAGQEVRFGTVSSLTNCIRGGTESSQFFVSITVNSLRNVIFKPDRSEFDKHIEQTRCPIQDYGNHNTSGEITLGTNSPPIYFISRPQQHTTIAKLKLPSANTASIIDGWTIKIIHLDQGGFSSAFAQVEFASDSVNLWSDGTQTAFNAGESKNIPIGSCWTIMCQKTLNKWVVTGWSKP